MGTLCTASHCSSVSRYGQPAGHMNTVCREMALKSVSGGWAAIDSCATGRLPPLLAEYHQRYPEVTLELVTGQWPQLLDDVQHHRLDAAIVAIDVQHPKLLSTALYHEPLILIAGAARRAGRGLGPPSPLHPKLPPRHAKPRQKEHWRGAAELAAR